MNDESSMTSRWRAGCALAFGAGCVLMIAYQPVADAIDWLARAPGGPGISQTTLMLLKGASFVILGPLLIVALARLLRGGVAQGFVKLFSLWLEGVKIVILCLLVFCRTSFSGWCCTTSMIWA